MNSTPSTPFAGAASQSPAARTWRRLIRHKGAITGFLLLLALAAPVIAAPLLTTRDPIAVSPGDRLQAPSLQHPMGTDNLGRDVWTRFLYGGRVSLLVGLIAVSIGAVAGVGLGLVSGYYGKWLDVSLSWVVEVLLAFPGILLALVIVTILGPGLQNVMIAVGIAFVPSFMRMTRGSVLSARERTYVEAANALGVPSRSILLRHILPNILRPLIVLATLGVGTAILEGAALSFLGLGVQPPDPEWGAMLNAGQSFMRQGWWIAVFPGLGIFVAVLAVNLLGDGLSDSLFDDQRGA